ncbi:putative gamma-aminobutyric acid type B receptor subunit 2 [Apostichopus japonicus]|uniref:Putative gamma-aminobutyric acid type B receptor subunit 2 n=1 Tax=Stichopus japonicus TaxID=307972 RepID=A0A2G8L9K1_STIJA|nr:putative gamma-aminobutyric acid type B receptor subunit 2 [Apostichopus japonicus]
MSKCRSTPFPMVDCIIYFSCILMYCSIALVKSHMFPSLSDQDYLWLCKIKFSLLSVGLTVGLSAMVGLTWATYQASIHVGSRDKPTSSRKLYLIIAGFAAIDVIMLALLNQCYPLYVRIQPLQTEVDPNNPNHVLEYYATVCSPKVDVIPYVIFLADKVLLMLVGSFVSLDILLGNTTVLLGHSKHAAVSVYNVILFFCCGLTLMFILEEMPKYVFLFTSTLIICCTTVTVLMLFLAMLRESNSTTNRMPPSVNRELLILQEENSILKKRLAKLTDLVERQLETDRRVVEPEQTDRNSPKIN